MKKVLACLAGALVACIIGDVILLLLLETGRFSGAVTFLTWLLLSLLAWRHDKRHWPWWLSPIEVATALPYLIYKLHLFVYHSVLKRLPGTWLSPD